jgi:hypothetical protein
MLLFSAFGLSLGGEERETAFLTIRGECIPEIASGFGVNVELSKPWVFRNAIELG